MRLAPQAALRVVKHLPRCTNTWQTASHSSFSLLSFTLQGCGGALQLTYVRIKPVTFTRGQGTITANMREKGVGQPRGMRHPKTSHPPLISAAWIHNPWRSLRAQVSSVCPQISFVIPTTPRSGSAASSIETVVFVFVELFAGMASSNVWACWPLIFPPFYGHIP